MTENTDENINMTNAEIGQTLDTILDDKPKPVLTVAQKNKIIIKRYWEKVHAYELTLVPKDVLVYIEQVKFLSHSTVFMGEFIPFLQMLLKYLNGGEPLKNDFGFDRYTSLYALSTFNNDNEVFQAIPDTPMIFKIFEKVDSLDFSSFDIHKKVSFKRIMENAKERFAEIDELRGNHPRRTRYVMYVGASQVDIDDTELFDELKQKEVHFSCFSITENNKLIEAFQKLNFNDVTNDFSEYYTLSRYPVALVHGFDEAFVKKSAPKDATNNKDLLENDLISMVNNPNPDTSNIDCKPNLSISEMDPNYQQTGKQQVTNQHPHSNKPSASSYYPYVNATQKQGISQIPNSIQESIGQVHTPNSNVNTAPLSSMSQPLLQAAPNSVQSSHRSTPTSVVPSPQVNHAAPISSNPQQMVAQNVANSEQMMYDANPQTVKTSSPALSSDTMNMAPHSVPPRTPQATTPVIQEMGPLSQQPYQSQHNIPQHPSPANTPARYPNLYTNNNPNTMTLINNSAGPMYQQQSNQLSATNSSISVSMPTQAKRPMLINNSASNASGNIPNTINTSVSNPSNNIVSTNPSVNTAETAILFQGDLKYNMDTSAPIQVSVNNAKNLDLNFLSMASWDKQCQLNFFPLFESLKGYFAGISLANPNSIDGSDKDSGPNANQPVSAELNLAMNQESLASILNMLNQKNQVNFAFVQPCKDIPPDVHVQLFCMLSTGHNLKVFIPKDPKGLINEMKRKTTNMPQNIDQRRNPMMQNYYSNFGQPYTISSGSGHHHHPHRPSLMINHHRYGAPGLQPGQAGLMSSSPSIMISPTQQTHFYRAGIPQPPPGSFIQTHGGIMSAQQQYAATGGGTGSGGAVPPGIGGIVVTQQQQPQQQMVSMDPHHHSSTHLPPQ